mmetsp:Transcript_42557/g.99733  ORF Transcript_42557/g.99733 Transcript_42557/m.99733 type:complete len:239 (-) Transcript_42557:1600-2316(-)
MARLEGTRRSMLRPVEQVRDGSVLEEGEELLRLAHHRVGREAEATLHVLCGSRSAKGAHSDDVVRVLAPALRCESLHGQHRHAAREEPFFVVRRLRVEEPPTRHRHEPHAQRRERGRRGEERLDLRARAHEHDLRLLAKKALADGQLVCAERHLSRRRAVQIDATLPREGDDSRRLRVLEGEHVRAGHLVGVGRAEREEVRRRAQREKHLDGLVRRPVLAEADGVVRGDVDDAEVRER